MSKTTSAGKAIQDKVARSQQYRTDFVRYVLSEAQKSLIKQTEFGVDEFNDAVASFHADGYAFSFKFYEDESTWGCFLNPKGDDHRDHGWTLSSRGSTPFKAFKQLAFLQYTLFADGWPKTNSQRREELDD